MLFSLQFHNQYNMYMQQSQIMQIVHLKKLYTQIKILSWYPILILIIIEFRKMKWKWIYNDY
jgi:hypothetical protein